MCPDSSLLKTNKTVQIFNISVKKKDIRKVGFENSLDVQSFFGALYVVFNYRKSKTISKSSLKFHDY